MKYVHFFAAVLAALCSCETTLDDIPESRLPHTTPKLVVHAYISPQNPLINVSVTESIPLFPKSTANADDVVRNASVKISDGVHEAILIFDPATELYSINQNNFPIVASKTYSLFVSDGARSVSARCTVPGATPIVKSFQLDTLFSNNPSFPQDTTLTLKLDWQDIPADTNYYRVIATASIEYDVPDQGSAGKRVRSDFDFVWDNNSGRTEWQPDTHLDGALFHSPLGKATLPHFMSGKSENGLPKPFNAHSRLISVTMAVVNADSNYFHYHRSLQERMDNENPFSEPLEVYGNIRGGLGCFGAYNTGKLVYKPD